MKEYPPAYYADYLGLGKLLDAQQPLSEKYNKPAHDEMLFIIVHQAYELWFKQILHELNSVNKMFEKDYVDEVSISVAVSRLDRIVEIFKLIIQQLRILETMTSLDFLDFRNFITPASGFQSVQFRLIENKLGLKAEQRVMYNKKTYHCHFAEKDLDVIRTSENQKSLFDLLQRWLERTPFLELDDFKFWESYKKSVDAMLKADEETIRNNPIILDEKKEKELESLEKTRNNFDALFDQEKHDELVEQGFRRLSLKATHAALFIHLYRDQPILQLPFRLLTLIVDIDELITTWRYHHMLMVLRMIGTKIGTGGTSGHDYLKSTIENSRIFQDLFNMATFLIPRSALPDLPDKVKEKLGFFYTSQNS